MFVIIALLALVFGLTTGFALGRRSAGDADVRRELRGIRAVARPSAEANALYPYPHAANPGNTWIGGS